MPSGKWNLSHDVTEYMSFNLILSMVSSLSVAPSISWNTSTAYFWLDFSVLEIQKGPYHIPQLPKQRAKSSFFVMLFSLVFCHSQEKYNTNAAANPTSIHLKISVALPFIPLFETKMIFLEIKH